jgi:hypothetical protein
MAKEMPIPKWSPRLDKLDRICLKVDDCEKIVDWAETNGYLAGWLEKGFNIPLDEGIIEVETYVPGVTNKLYFSVDQIKQLFVFEFYFKEDMVLKFYWVNGDEEPTLSGYAQTDDWIHPVEDYMHHWFEIYILLMLYMVEYREDVQCLRREELSRPNPKFKKNKGGTKRTIKIGRYYISPPNPSYSSEPRHYDRKTEAWKVNGHWRHYKSGKTVWIAGHVRGNKNVVPDGKTYRI